MPTNAYSSRDEVNALCVPSLIQAGAEIPLTTRGGSDLSLVKIAILAYGMHKVENQSIPPHFAIYSQTCLGQICLFPLCLWLNCDQST